MLKNLIIIEGENQLQCDSEQDVVKALISNDYYQLSAKEQYEKMRLMATANLIGKPNVQIVDKENIKEGKNLENKFVLLDEKTYVLSLLINSNVNLLENTNSNVYIGALNKSKFTKNYVLVNKFAKELLEKYVNNYFEK